MQFTGLLDRTKWEELTQDEQLKWIDRGETKESWKGKEIWEGDIIYETYFGLEIIGEVKSFGWSWGLSGKVKYPTETWGPFNSSDTFAFGTQYHKVIGNICENPELLEAKDA